MPRRPPAHPPARAAANANCSALNPIVKPVPVLQILNILFGLLGLAWEYPLPFLIPGTGFHRSIGARLALYPISVFVAILLYQGTNAAIYYLFGIATYFWAYSEGEVCSPCLQIDWVLTVLQQV